MRPADAAEISADKPTAVRVTIAVTPLLLESSPTHPYAQSKGGLRVSRWQIKAAARTLSCPGCSFYAAAFSRGSRKVLGCFLQVARLTSTSASAQAIAPGTVAPRPKGCPSSFHTIVTESPRPYRPGSRLSSPFSSTAPQRRAGPRRPHKSSRQTSGYCTHF